MKYNDWNNFFGKYFNEYMSNFLDMNEEEDEKVTEKMLVDHPKNKNHNITNIEYLEDLYKQIDEIQNPIIIECDRGCSCVRVFYSKEYKIIELPKTFLENQTIKEILYHYKNENNLVIGNIIFNINNINDSFGEIVGIVLQKDDSKHIIKTDIYFRDFHFGDNKEILNALLEKSESFKKEYLKKIKILKNEYTSFLNSIKQSDENELYMELLENE